MSRREIMTTQYRNNTNDPPKKYRLGTISKSILLKGSNLNKFQNALPSDFELLLIKVLIFCILSDLTKDSIYSRTLIKMPSILFQENKYHLFGITQVLYQLTLNSHKSLLSRYTAGYISDNKKHRICSKVNIDKHITLCNSQVHLNGIFCALIDSSQPAMTMLF